MRILLVNDDGYKAPGIQALFQHLQTLEHEVYICAPLHEQSGKSHAVSFSSPVTAERKSSNVYAVHGTPADSTIIGLYYVLKDNPPDLVISGINYGFNVGRDVTYSGTVGAATEAALCGFKSLAVSMEYSPKISQDEVFSYFQNVAQFIGRLLELVPQIPWPAEQVLNINYPLGQPKGVALATCSSVPLYAFGMESLTFNNFPNLSVHYIGGRIRQDITESSDDVSLVTRGYISMSFLEVRQSHTANTLRLSEVATKLNEALGFPHV